MTAGPGSVLLNTFLDQENATRGGPRTWSNLALSTRWKVTSPHSASSRTCAMSRSTNNTITKGHSHALSQAGTLCRPHLTSGKFCAQAENSLGVSSQNPDGHD